MIAVVTPVSNQLEVLSHSELVLVGLFQSFSSCLLMFDSEPALESIGRSSQESCKLSCCLLILYLPFWHHFPVIP